METRVGDEEHRVWRDPSIQRADDFANMLFRLLVVAAAVFSLPFVVFSMFSDLVTIGAALRIDGAVLVTMSIIGAAVVGGVIPIAIVLNAVLRVPDPPSVNDGSVTPETSGPFYPYPEGTWRLVAGHGLPGMNAGSPVGLAVEDGRLRFYRPGVAALASEPVDSTIVTAVNGGVIEIRGDNVHVRLVPLDVDVGRIRALLERHRDEGATEPRG